MKKKGQFYFIAMIIIAAIFIGLVTIQNVLEIRKPSSINYLENELNIEKGKVLDYIVYQNLDETNSQNILTNFSKEYTKKIGNDKDIIFTIGSINSIKLIGNKIEETNISYNLGNGFENITETGEFEIPLTPINENVNLSLNNITYSLKIEKGQNLYYLIQHSYDEEVDIIYG